MRRLSILILLVGLSLARADEQVQVFATNVDTDENVLYATGDVLVLYQDYYLSAKKVRYDRQNGVVELFENVTVMKGSNYHMLGGYAMFDLRQDKRQIAPFYMLEKESEVWMACENAQAAQDQIDLSSGMVSGCDPNDPLWKIRFSSSDYNTESMWLNLYNARIVMGEVPIFYMPYFGYSLDTTRRSGLLIPSFGLSDDEGFYYEQPIYIAEQNWWDLELRPQIRTKRGKGLYGQFRFVDSQYSNGQLKFGTFNEKSSYTAYYNLENSDHYGVNFNYVNQDVLKQWAGIETDGQSGAYFDINWMNDIDYINLSHTDETLNTTTSQVFSRANLFYNEEKNYFGSYFKYYLDLTKDNNDETIQNLPILHYHRYLETWLDDHLLYNVDVNINNLHRKIGVTARQIEADLPVTLRGSFFDDFVDVSVGTQLYGKYINFDDSTATYDSGKFARSTNNVKVGTYLTRGYDSFVHAIGMDVIYVENGLEHRSGYFDVHEGNCELDPYSEVCSFYKITDIEEATKLQMSQYIFDDQGRQILYHRLAQSINADDDLSELENELEWQIWPEFSFYSDTIYDHDLDTVTKQLTTMRYINGDVTASLSHFYEDRVRRAQPDDSSYITFNVEYQHDKNYRYFAGYDYDVEKQIKKKVEAGFLYSKRCWDFGLRYLEYNRPILQDGGVNSVYDKYLYVTIILKPMGGSDIQYQLNESSGG